MSIRFGQVVFWVHIPSSRMSALAKTMSLYVMAAMATFDGFPASLKTWYLHRISGLNRDATNAGM